MITELNNSYGLRPYNDKAFVAFVDISGFKSYMKESFNKASKCLDDFYQICFDVILPEDMRKYLDCLVISDCCILIGRIYDDNNGVVQTLEHLLSAIKEININMLRHKWTLTTSVAYGYYKYENRMVFNGIAKEAIIGTAYLNAYLDSASGEPKLKQGDCRIVLKNNFPTDEIKNIRKDIQTLINNGTVRKYYRWYLQDDMSLHKQYETDIKKCRKKYKDGSKYYDEVTKTLCRYAKINFNTEED